MSILRKLSNKIQLYNPTTGDSFLSFDSNNDEVSVEGNDVTEVGGSPDANAGAIRLASGSNISWRNNADSGDFGIETNSSDDIVLNSGGNVEIPNGNLSITEGNSIVDDGGTNRFSLESDRTELLYEQGSPAITARDGVVLELRARSGTPVEIFDDEGNFDAVQYTTDAITGTLGLPNAVLQVFGTHSNFGGRIYGGDGSTDYQLYSNTNDNGNFYIEATDTNRDVYAKDGNGNTTQISP